MKKLLFLLLILPFLGNSQATFTAPVGYNTGAPTATPSGVGTRWRFDLLTGKKYTWLPGSLSWDEDARGIDQVAGCSAPLYTPGYNQSTFAVNSCTVPELYQWTGAAWVQLNEGAVYTAGTGISIDGSNVISNSAPDQTVTMTDGTGIDVTGTYPNFTVTNTSPNVVQTLSIAGQDLTLSNGGGTVEIPAGDALGTGFTSGGGTGTIPAGTIANRGSASLRFTGDYDETAALYYENAPILNRVEVNQDGFFFRATDEDHTINFSAESGGNGTFEASSATVVFNARSGGIINFSNNVSNLSFDNGNGKVVFTDGGATPLGIEYSADYSATIITNPTSFTDVTSVNLLKQTPVSYTNAAAPNNCIFYSTTLSKLAYKDPGGTVNPLY